MSARNSYNVAPIPGDNNGGSGGGGGDGPSADGGVPIGSVLPFAGATAPPKFLLCNGGEYRRDGEYEDLYNVTGFSYGVNPSVETMLALGAYTLTSANVLSITLSGINYFLQVGGYAKIEGFVVNDGPNVNGAVFVVTSAPAVGAITGTIVGNFVPPINVAGSGNAGFPVPPLSALDRWSFEVPDLRLAGPIGFQAGTIELGTSGGSATTTITANNLPSHQHGLFQPGSTALTGAGQQAGTANVDANLRTIRGETYVEGTTEGNGALVQNLPISVRNPYVAMNYIIKAET